VAIVLIGFMGAGKSTAARELGAALGRQIYDSDELLAAQFGHSVAEEFARSGEAAFREAEERLVLELLDSARPEEVIALGGGAVLSERVQKRLEGEAIVLLDVDAETAWERVSRNGAGAGRPLAGDREEFLALHGRRAPLYERLAKAVVGALPIERLSALAPSLRVLRGLEGAGRLLWASAASGDYPVLIGNGLLSERGPALLSRWPLDRAASRAFCVSDETVLALHGEALGARELTIALAPGEASKTLAGAGRVWGELAAAGMTRADHVVALGGGVVGDLAGFCAASYQRGVPVVQVPTTLVAQVDSAYGGKTGIDLPAAKNYVGAYHQPAGVLVDPGVLDTLPQAELAAGWVEVLKTALIAGGTRWESVAAGAEHDEQTITACVRAKLAIVAADERDGGRRQVLNLGHTVGHAIETASGYSRFRHGEAVGLGLLAALRLSEQPQLREQVRELLERRALPVRLEGVEIEAVMAAIARDKKRLTEDVPFVLLAAPGDVSHGHRVPEERVREAVQELTR
jgi:shikimate kinase/3-dehydroquinate synthase